MLSLLCLGYCYYYFFLCLSRLIAIEHQATRIQGDVVAELNRRLRTFEEQDIPRQIAAAADNISQSLTAQLVGLYSFVCAYGVL